MSSLGQAQTVAQKHAHTHIGKQWSQKHNACHGSLALSVGQVEA